MGNGDLVPAKEQSSENEKKPFDNSDTKVHRWLKRNSDYKANGRDNIEMAFMYSECGNEWKEVLP